MKKLGVSLVAVLVGLPMMAHATISTISDAGTATANTNVATTSYVKGAYNAMASAVNTAIGQANTDIAAKQAQLVNNAETPANISNTVKTTVGAATGQNAASDEALVTEKAVRDAIDTATTGAVTLNGTQTLTNKTIDADDNTISDLGVGNFKSGTVVDSSGDGIAAANSASDTKLVTEKAVATALADKADAATTLSGYGITDAYTKTEVDTALSGKANTATTLSGYGITDAYTKTEVDAHGFNVYGNWATPDTSTGSVTITSAGLTSNGNGGGNGGGE